MSVSMGYAVNVTAMQMASAASVVANGGELVQPHIVRAWIDGNRRTAVPKKVIRRVISAETADELTTMMEGVAERGTAKIALTALMKDYSVAGKTGTSNKNDGHRYIEAYNTSFVGFVPSRKPALTVLVHIDTPRGPKKKAGGAIAAPIFQRFADVALRHLGVPPTVSPASPVLVAQSGHSSAPVTVPVSGTGAALTIMPAVAPLSAGQIVLPDLRGLSGREALRVLARIGVTPRMNGDGVVTEQEPLPGTPVDIGGTCRLALGRPATGFLQ
jgi:stage V sporulation protein D (sporulation-specific penicillin-binding protein)